MEKEAKKMEKEKERQEAKQIREEIGKGKKATHSYNTVVHPKNKLAMLATIMDPVGLYVFFH